MLKEDEAAHAKNATDNEAQENEDEEVPLRPRSRRDPSGSDARGTKRKFSTDEDQPGPSRSHGQNFQG